MTDTQIKFLIHLKNEACLGREIVSVPNNIQCLDLLFFLYKEGLILRYSKEKDRYVINLRYYHGRNELSTLKIVSKPTYEHVFRYKDICKIVSDKTIWAILTDKGLKNLNQCKKDRFGGKLLFYVS